MGELKRVLITGGTGKVGGVLATGFAQKGWQVVITSRNEKQAKQKAKQIEEETGGTVFGLGAELNKDDKLSSFISELVAHNLLPNCLINNARNLENLRVGEDGHPLNKSWHEEFQLSVVAAFELSMQLADIRKGCLENVINISSMYGVVAATPHLYDNPMQQSPIHYSICKAALIHLTKELAVRLAAKNIRVNAISYGGVQGRVTDEFISRYAHLTPQGRMLNEADIAGPALFLSSEATAVTGHNLIVDGGWSIW